MPKTKIKKSTRRKKQLFRKSSSSTRSSTTKATSSPARKQTRAKKPLFVNPPQKDKPDPKPNHRPLSISTSKFSTPTSTTSTDSPVQTTTPQSLGQTKPINSPPPAPPNQIEVNDHPTDKKSSSPDEISSLRQLIQKTSQRLQELESEKIKQDAKPTPAVQDPQEFDGVDTDTEEHQIIHDQLEKLEKQNSKLKRQLQLTKEEFEKEKQHLQNTIRELRSEVKRSAPLQDSKFFSISKELREAVKAIENLNDPTFTPPTETDTVVSSSPTIIPSSPSSSPNPSPQPKIIKVSQEPETKSSPPKKKDNKDKKLLITGGAIISLISVGGLLSWRLTAKPQIDQDIVNSYLQEQGQVQGIQTQNQALAKQNKKIATDKYLEIPFDQTEWDTFEDLVMGFNLRYPLGITEKLSASSSLTILRKQGYLFKVQIYETDLTPKEFWSQQQPSVAYNAIPSEINGHDALHLQLIDQVEFPGDRYLLANAGKIYDIWVATPSDKFSQDDIKRAEFMLNSFRII